MEKENVLKVDEGEGGDMKRGSGREGGRERSRQRTAENVE